MKRVCVIGCSGAGKTTLAGEIATRTGLPYVSLDAHYWQPEWVIPQKDAWHRVHDGLIEANVWVIDGNYIGTMVSRLPAADTVVFLDYPRWRCLLGAVTRTVMWWGRTRPEMAPGCPDHFDLEFLRYIWHFRDNPRRRIIDVLEHFPHLRVVRVRNGRERTQFLASL